MAGNTDPQRRPVLYDLRNKRLLADPAIGTNYYVIPSLLDGDATIDLINTATSSVILAARVAAGSTSSAGVLQLTDSTSSASTTTAATPNAVKSAYDLAGSAQSTAIAAQSTANAALPKSGGTMSGPIVFAAGQTIAGYAALATVQTFTAAQRGSVSTLSPGAVVTPDFAVSNNFSLALDQNTTLENPLNLTAGQSGAIVITQDATGRTLSYGSYWKFNGGAPSLDTTAASVSVLAYYVESTSRITAVLVQNSIS